MRRSVLSIRSRTLSQVAAISLLAGLTAACSADANKFGIPAFTGSTANQKDIIGGAQPMPAPIASVQRQDLPPPANQQTLLPGVAQSTMPPATYQPSVPAPYQPPAAAQVAAATSSAPLVKAAKGGWNATGGTVVTLGPGETLSSLSRRYGVPVKDLAKANNITDPSKVGTGARIVIPTFAAADGSAPKKETEAVATAASTPKRGAPSAEATPLGGLHTVAPGETLITIARLYNVSAKDLEAANHINSPQDLQIGERLKIPSKNPTQTAAIVPEPTRREEAVKGEDPSKKSLAKNGSPKSAETKEASAAKSASGKSVPATEDPATTASIPPATGAAAAAAEMASPDSKGAPAIAYAPSDDSAATAVAADPGSANGTTFRWPVRGRIIGSFGASATGDKNDGINLAVPEGTSIKAVEAGTVIYAGNELEGYGQLVLIRHADGWVSAYAHNSDILVKRGDAVRRGQIISRAGATGSVSSPQLHFELRKGSKPVNPLDYLTG